MNSPMRTNTSTPIERRAGNQLLSSVGELVERFEEAAVAFSTSLMALGSHPWRACTPVHDIGLRMRGRIAIGDCYPASS